MIKINRDKFKSLSKRCVLLATTVVTLATFSSCSKEIKNDKNVLINVSQENNEFDKFCKTIIRNGNPVVGYNINNISLSIDKDTFEVKEYIYNVSGLSGQVYDLVTGELLVDVFVLTPNNLSENNWNIIKENKYIIDFFNIGDYIENIELKEYYTLEEIKSIEPQLIDSLKLIIEYNKKYQKIKQ